MSYDTILTSCDGPIFSVTLNRPDQLNALSPTLLSELKDALDVIRADKSIAVVVIKASGRVFSPGYDLTEKDWIISQYPPNFPNGVEVQQDREDVLDLLDYWFDLWRYPKPIITQVQGDCLSGACELLAVCDLAVASENARFGHPAGRDLGIPPTSFFWPLLIGMRKTREMLYTASLMGAGEAYRLGLINYVVPHEALESKVDELATNIARTPVDNLTILKQATNAWYENMGAYESSVRGVDLDVVFHQSETFKEFFNVLREKGTKAAFKHREERFR